VASGQRPAFGVGERSQGTPQRFGGGGERSPHFGATEAGPRRSPSGREFVYHGQHFARFAGPHYHWPHGGRYHRYAVGYRLPRDYFIRDYYIDDYDDYGLASPPPDFEWIRYGPDILLVDLDTGEIAQTVYGAFDEVDDSDAPPPDGDPDQ
jgi:Ni/Co efflux regulator RcnB